MNILITGASRGIGFDTALELAKDPGNTILAFSRNAEGLKRLEHDATNGNIRIFAVDITKLDEHDMSAILSTQSNLDILINNAGQIINKRFDALHISEWKQIFESNFFGTINMINAALPLLKNSTVSHIVNIGSMGGFQGTSKFEGLSAYSASKAALANLTECLAEEFKLFNIRVNCLALGAVSTEMLKEAFPDYAAPITSQEMGKFIANFSVHNHHYMNGKTIPVSLSTP